MSAATRREPRTEVAGIGISSPRREVDAASGTRKLALVRFYADIADWLLPHLDDRPVSLVRAPDGIAEEQFFQRHAQRLAIPGIKQLDPSLDPGHDPLMEIDNLQALVGAVQMNSVEFHTWNASSRHIGTPDRLVLDLDPDPALPWSRMQEATRQILGVLDQLELETFLKTSGGKGMHLVVPLSRRADWDTVKAFGKALAEFMTRQLPKQFSATMGPKHRVGKIFIDYLRNQHGASTVAAYSLRARPGLPASVPIRRDELDAIDGAGHWHIGNLKARLESQDGDPWAGYGHRQRITRNMWTLLGSTPP